MMTKKQLRDELFSVKFALRDALLLQVSRMGGEARSDAFTESVYEIWKRMNSRDYK